MRETPRESKLFLLGKETMQNKSANKKCINTDENQQTSN